MSTAINDEKEDSYKSVLGRGGLSEWRLTFQHFLTTQQQGWIIHPDIEAALSNRQDVRIADIASGNGIWALTVAEKYPKAKVLGTDISDVQFPNKVTLPSNASFEVQDAFNEVPHQYRGAFDLVHLRLTVGWIVRKDKELLIRNVLSMLKPNGYIQWEENTSPPIWFYEPDGRIERGLPKAWERCLRLSGMLPEFQWLATLPSVFTRHGLVDAIAVEPKPTRSMLPAHRQCLTWTMQEVFETLVAVGVPNAKEEYAMAMEEQQKEWAAGRQLAYGWTVAMAKKPA